MLRFARKSGTDLSQELIHQIAQLDWLLKQHGVDPVADIPMALVSGAVPSGDIRPSPTITGPSNSISAEAALPEVIVDVSPKPAADNSAMSEVKNTDALSQPNSLGVGELALKVHGELSKVVAPATALSLHTTEPPPGKRGFLGGMPLVVKWAAIIALISAVGFVISAGVIAKGAAKAATEKAAAEKAAADKHLESLKGDQAGNKKLVPPPPVTNGNEAVKTR